MTNRKCVIIVISILTLILSSCGTIPDRAITLEEILGEDSTDLISASEESEQEEATPDVGPPDQTLVEPGTIDRAAEEPIYVFVCGAVKEPGVVELNENSRVKDALEAAGGFSEDACTMAVNLAGRLLDGEQIYFPTQKEYEADLKGRKKAADPGQGVSAQDYIIYDTGPVLVDSGSSRININTASSEDLQRLPGIGESRARDIINYREGNGGFGKIEDIMKVSGIKESIFSKISSMITV